MFSFAEFHNLIKLPVLFEHFKEHKNLDAKISFWSFIRLHYFDPIQVDEDYQRDRQLPFRDMDCSLVVSASICDFSPVIFDLILPTEEPREFPCYKEINKPQFPSFDIFQPPRPMC